MRSSAATARGRQTGRGSSVKRTSHGSSFRARGERVKMNSGGLRTAREGSSRPQSAPLPALEAAPVPLLASVVVALVVVLLSLRECQRLCPLSALLRCSCGRGGGRLSLRGIPACQALAAEP